jgi:hypothetical protein
MLDPTTATADQILDNMEYLVERERLVRGSYIDQEVDPERSGALCQGHKACAIGSLWLAAGVPVRPLVTALGRTTYMLPGTDEWERDEFVEDKPGLKLAYTALNDAAEVFADEHGIGLDLLREDSGFEDAIEALFEGTTPETANSDDPVYLLSRDDLLTIIIDARTNVQTPGAVSA